MGSEYTRIKTSPEVWAVIKARHHVDLKVFGSFSDPDGDHSSGEGRMETSFGLDGADYPLMEAKTTWEINPDPNKRYHRINEKHEYWLCIPLKEED